MRMEEEEQKEKEKKGKKKRRIRKRRREMIRWSISTLLTCATTDGIRVPPAAPITMTTLQSLSTIIVGDISDGILFPGTITFAVVSGLSL